MTKALKPASFVVVLLCGIGAHRDADAACIGSSPDLTAASGSRKDVADCVEAATYGDTIHIPACDGSASDWTSSIVIHQDVKIIGAGKGLTTINLNFSASSIGPWEYCDSTYEAAFWFVPDQTSRGNLDSLEDTHTFEVAGITFKGKGREAASKYALWIHNYNLPIIKRVNIHDNEFIEIDRAVGGPKGYVHGVFHSNTLHNANAYYEQGAGPDGFVNDRRLPGRGDGWYVEDNTLTVSDSEMGVGGAVNDGGGTVARYNTFSGIVSGAPEYFDIHSHDGPGTGAYGGQLMEIYGNNLTAAHPDGNTNRAVYMRGGKNIYFYNIFAGGEYSAGIDIIEEGSEVWAGVVLDNGCEDKQDEKQICTDSCFCQKVHDSYFLNNRRINSTLVPWSISGDYWALFNTKNDPPELDEDVEFFNHNDSFNGTSGVGCGTLSEMNDITPTTLGVGFWVPENIVTMPCTSLSPDNIGRNPKVPISGTLYKWNGSEWTAFWTPYTYPHPLRNGESSLVQPTPPSKAPSSGSGCSASGEPHGDLAIGLLALLGLFGPIVVKALKRRVPGPTRTQ